LEGRPEKLHHYLDQAIALDGTKTYLKTSERSHTYGRVNDMADNYQDQLRKSGASAGDRVVIYSSKNASSVALMAACSRMGVIYVPVSSLNPAGRAAHIIEETKAILVFCDEACTSALRESELDLKFKESRQTMSVFQYADPSGNSIPDDDTAFILYTSGSTGRPKGVAISHRAAMVFVAWSVHTFKITNEDVLTSIAPFNFDLSVFDLYVSAMTGATLLLYTEQETKNARLMAMRLSEDKATTIYGTPTFFTTLAYFGKLDRYDFSSLTNVLFAGEVFPPENFSRLYAAWGEKNYFNLYGPTETNVCTYHKVDLNALPEKAFPIGKCCAYAGSILVDEEDKPINSGEGELLISGDSLFNGYWKDAEKTQESLFHAEDGIDYYRTGDIASLNDQGEYIYVGRKDRMIKKYGFRIEPSEIENAVLGHERVSIAAVLLDSAANKLVCFVETNDKDLQSSLREHCLRSLPQYMVPDKFVIFDSMPRTSSGKVDLQSLQALL